jgi:hypothetical protein
VTAAAAGVVTNSFPPKLSPRSRRRFGRSARPAVARTARAAIWSTLPDNVLDRFEASGSVIYRCNRHALVQRAPTGAAALHRNILDSRTAHRGPEAAEGSPIRFGRRSSIIETTRVLSQ